MGKLRGEERGGEKWRVLTKGPVSTTTIGGARPLTVGQASAAGKGTFHACLPCIRRYSCLSMHVNTKGSTRRSRSWVDIPGTFRHTCKIPSRYRRDTVLSCSGVRFPCDSNEGHWGWEPGHLWRGTISLAEVLAGPCSGLKLRCDTPVAVADWFQRARCLTLLLR